MLKIFNDLEPFFMDNYRRIGVRVYSRIRKVSPPSASTLLEDYHKEGLLCREEDRRYIFYSSNKDNGVFVQLSRAYWLIQIKKSGLIDYLNEQLLNPLIMLFGSFSKAEISPSSDIDLVVANTAKKKLNLAPFEKKLSRSIQLIFHDEAKIELHKSIMNGFILSGGW